MNDPRKLSLLIIEDDPADAELVRRVLSEGGVVFDSRRVQTEPELRAALSGRLPDAVLTDYSLPALDAPRAVAVVRELAPAVPVICVSGSIGEQKAVELLKLGAVDYIMKDAPARLVSSLGRALEEARVIRERDAAERELRLSRERLAQAEKMDAIGRLAGGVAHDFNNILTTITGCCELLESTLAPDAASLVEVRAIASAAQRATKLTRQLLAFGRRQNLELRVLELNAVIVGFEPLLRRLVGTGVSLELSLSPDCRRVRADETQLEQILMNLAINARDAMGSKGRLTVTTREEDGRAVLVVSDDGPGMSPDVAARVFEPFYTTKERGTGLGLATVFGIVHQSGGTIELETAPGRGARFTIRLPVTEAPGESTRASAPLPAIGAGEARGEAIMLVDDDASLLSLARRALEGAGYRVHPFASPEDALEAAARGLRVDAALLDVVLGSMDGPTLLSRLRASQPGLKALYMSGYAAPGVLPDPISGRPYAFIQKPFSVRTLISKVRETLELSAS
jgi:two-component system, cell cycle sensor histidine kinase and response regulator CckA